MRMLQSRVDIAVTALWRPHEDTATIHIYLEVAIAMKEAALKRLHEPTLQPLTYKAARPTPRPSSKRCYYADHPEPEPPAATRSEGRLRIVQSCP
jgi:hypothetical protein